MTPERLQELKWQARQANGLMLPGCIELQDEIERLQAKLAELQKHLDLALPKAAQACQIESANARLREALTRYKPHHHQTCRLHMGDLCDCDYHERMREYDAALAVPPNEQP